MGCGASKTNDESNDIGEAPLSELERNPNTPDKKGEEEGKGVEEKESDVGPEETAKKKKKGKKHHYKEDDNLQGAKEHETERKKEKEETPEETKEDKGEKAQLKPLTEEELRIRRSKYACGNQFFTLEDVTPYMKWLEENGIQPNSASEYTYSRRANKRIGFWVGDLTKIEIDAIVNAANNSLMGGGGIDGCIHRAAGPELVKYNATLGGCKTGEAKLSPGFNLPARYVVSTVGPRTEDRAALGQCYMSCLDLAAQTGIRTIAFCCISTGIFGFSNDVASDVAICAVREWLDVAGNSDHIDLIVFGLFMKVDIELYKAKLPFYFPPRTKKHSDK